MEDFGLTGVFTGFSAVWCCAIEVPEDTVGSRRNKVIPRTHVPPKFLLPSVSSHTGTYHHQECRKPGGSPRVMFFSQRIYQEEDE